MKDLRSVSTVLWLYEKQLVKKIQRLITEDFQHILLRHLPGLLLQTKDLEGACPVRMKLKWHRGQTSGKSKWEWAFTVEVMVPLMTWHPKIRLSSFSIHYTNICGLNSNFSSVESHLVTSSPNLFLLSETQLSSQSFPDPFQISHYNFYSRFRSKGGICAYCNINTPIARLMDLESPHFDVLWLKIYLPTTTIFLCFATAPLMLPTFPPSLSILLLAMSLCCLHTHALKFSIWRLQCTPRWLAQIHLHWCWGNWGISFFHF